MAEPSASLSVFAAGREARTSSETAFAYLMLVKKLLADNRKSIEFANILEDIGENFKPPKSGVTEEICRVKYFLRDRPLLILGFSQFLPEADRHRVLLKEDW